MLVRVLFAAMVTALLGVATLALVSGRRGAEGSDAALVAASWVGSAATQSPRRDGDGWDVDIFRADGSLVEVTIGDRLELLGLDEEIGPGGARAHDEVEGAARARAVHAARAVSPGRVLGVERERDGEIEVAISKQGGDRVEVGLDRRLRLIEVEPEHPDDE